MSSEDKPRSVFTSFQNHPQGYVIMRYGVGLDAEEVTRLLNAPRSSCARTMWGDKMIIAAMRDAGAEPRHWAALTYESGPYSITTPGSFIQQFTANIDARLTRPESARSILALPDDQAKAALDAKPAPAAPAEGPTPKRLEPQYVAASVSGAWLLQWQDRADQLERELAAMSAVNHRLAANAIGARSASLTPISWMWIPVSERLPDLDVPCLVYFGNGSMQTAHHDGHFFHRGSYFYGKEEVTHWMPLPTAPRSATTEPKP